MFPPAATEVMDHIKSGVIGFFAIAVGVCAAAFFAFIGK
jgi:hypothetical protein